MDILSFFRRRSDGRCEPAPDVSQIESDLAERLAQRKAARLTPDPHKRGHITRHINRSA
jgi:hypothetical protein